MKRKHFVIGFSISLVILFIIIFIAMPSVGIANNTPNDLTEDTIKDQDEEFTTDVVVDGLNKPWDLSFVNDNTFIYNQKNGEVRVHDISASEDWTLHTLEDVYNRGEGGLLGGVADVEFNDNRYYYVCSNITGPSVSVIRLELNNTLTAVTERKDIITGIPSNNSGRHSGCRINMDNHGHLWIGTGDTANGTLPQSLNSLGGKVLRVDREGNGFSNNILDDADNRIFNIGHRNVQGITLFDSAINGVYGYTSEHGSNRDDEINLLISGNFGWDPIPGYNESVEMTDLDKFPEAVSAIWSSGDPTIAISGMTIIKGEQWGKWEGAVALAVQKDSHIRIIKFDAEYEIEFEEKIIIEEFGRIRTVVQSPNGNLYFATDNGSNDKIVRLSPKN